MNTKPILAAILALATLACGGPAATEAPIAVGPSGSKASSLTIIQQPASVTAHAGNQVSFMIECPGATSFQWVSGDSTATLQAIPGATGATYTINQVTKLDNGKIFMVRPSNGTVSTESAIATLTVYWMPSVTQHPESALVKEDSPATFTAGATGFPVPTLGWQTSADGTTWTALPGIGSTLSFSARLQDDGSQFRMVATNEVGSTYSDPATLFVSELPQYLLTFKTQSSAGFPKVSENSQLVKEGQESKPVSTIQSWTNIPDGSSGKMPDLDAHNYEITRSGFEAFNYWKGSDNSVTFQDPIVVTGRRDTTYTALFFPSPALTDLRILKGYWQVLFEVTELNSQFPLNWSFVLHGGQDEGRVIGTGTITHFTPAGVTSQWITVPQFSIHSAMGGSVTMEVTISNASGSSQVYRRLLDKKF